MSRLLHSIKDTNTRVLFTGDYRQLGAVEAGNPFGALMKSGISTANLTEHRRQKNAELKQAVESISKGKYQHIKSGLDKLSEHIFERKGQDSRINFVAKKYLGLSSEDREKTLVLADTNKEKEILTRRIREGLKGLGQLDKKEFNVQTLIPKDLTEAQKRVAAFYDTGMVVMTNSKSHTLGLNEQYSVVDRTGKYLVLESKNGLIKVDPKTENLSVYESKILPIAAGDKLEWRRNHDGRINREQVLVEAIDEKNAILRTENGDRESINLGTKQLFDYAHVKTTYSSQGLTADRVIALTHSNLSKESLYVLTSRAMHEVEIVTDSKEKLLARASRSSEKANVLDGAKMQDLLNLSQANTAQLEIER
jgi:ATP-dependent exoDNAse (exonuclease V) alpha subunit